MRLSEVYNRRNLIKKYSGISEVKELDAETGLYYYGARYLDPRTSRWLSGDPAIYEGDYLPSPGQDPSKLGGMGGVYNIINLHAYHYGANSPIKYIDPDGRRNRIIHRDDRNRGRPGYVRHVYTTNNGVTVETWRRVTTPAQTVTPSTPVIQGKISMIDAFGTDDGPCIFRALLGIAETRGGRSLTQGELATARRMFYGSNNNTNWRVKGARADGLNPSRNIVEDVINIGLELIGSSERASLIYRGTTLPNNEILQRTHAMLLQVTVGSESSSGVHFLEGDTRGNMIFDPLDNIDRYRSMPISRYDAFEFYNR
ncbi:MAG: RHS repeat-associated core domain-containing protein [Treponema sp.]|nr:RHS repeat-associated core domain-containing protein [Treponema sp.]